MQHRVMLPGAAGFELWRPHARRLLAKQIAPENVVWSVQDRPDLLPLIDIDELCDGQEVDISRSPAKVPRAFVEQATTAMLHADGERFALLYRILWRITHAEPHLLDVEVDADMVRLAAMLKAVHRDMHKMKAFVRFRELQEPSDTHGLQKEPCFVAWFEPEHHILAATAPFFVRRFTNMRFSIITPELSAHWDREQLWFAPGGNKALLPSEDANEDLWRLYYASIFNPARLKLAAMNKEMPKKYWRNLPEASLIEHLSDGASSRTTTMIEALPTKAAPSPKAVRRLKAVPSRPPAQPGDANASDRMMWLRDEAAACRDCGLWQAATQTVFGVGPRDAKIMIVGEQPGDQEDLAGRPFVGPAGQLLDRALFAAGVARDTLYVTNAVKHFKFVVRGKRRLHQSPVVREIEVCSQWLTKEIETIVPSLIVALGASAAHALFRRATPVKANRGKIIEYGESRILVTVHPSYLLRLTDPEIRRHEESLFIDDLKLIASHLAAQQGI